MPSLRRWGLLGISSIKLSLSKFSIAPYIVPAATLTDPSLNLSISWIIAYPWTGVVKTKII